MSESPGGEASDGGGVSLADGRGRWVLAATVMGSGMATLDSTVVNLALPRIGTDLDAGFGGVQWILNGYTLSLAALILVGGSLGDHFGRRRLFIIGAAWFTVASAVCAFAPNVGVLIAARVFQGIGGALLTPGSLAIIQASFRPEDRARAIGTWSGLGGVASALGPFIGGWLVDAASWRWIFLINLPLGVAVVTIAGRHVPESRDTQGSKRLDVPGAVLGALALAATSYGLSQQRWAVLIVGIVLFAAFIAVEMRVVEPMLPLGVFRNRAFSATNTVTFLLYGAFAVALFLLGLVLQGPLGYSPLRAGVATVPVTILMLVFSARAGALAQRIGPRIPMTLGPVLVAVGLVTMTRINESSNYFTGVLPGVLIFGAGLCLTVAPLTTTALGSVEERHAGIASGANNAVARTGQLVFVAAVPVLAGFAPGDVVGGAVLLDGFHQVLWVSASVITVAAAIAWFGLGRTAGRPTPLTAAPRVPVFHCAASGPPPAVEVRRRLSRASP